MNTWTIERTEDGWLPYTLVDGERIELDACDTRRQAERAAQEQMNLDETLALAADLEARGVEFPDGVFSDDPASLPSLRALAQSR
jgi:hypothetical protein